MTKLVTSGKTNFARLIATENLTVIQELGIKTPSFDLVNRILRLPVWEDISEDMADFLIGHETAHAIDTPPDGWKDAIGDMSTKLGCDKEKIAAYLNVVEDIRIDLRQKRRFPGIKYAYNNAAKELVSRDFFGLGTNIPEANAKIDSLNLGDRLNLYFRTRFEYDIPFKNQTEFDFRDELEKIETWEEVLDVTERLYKYCQEEQLQMPSGGSGGADSEKKDDNQNQDGEGNEPLEIDASQIELGDGNDSNGSGEQDSQNDGKDGQGKSSQSQPGNGSPQNQKFKLGNGNSQGGSSQSVTIKGEISKELQDALDKQKANAQGNGNSQPGKKADGSKAPAQAHSGQKGGKEISKDNDWTRISTYSAYEKKLQSIVYSKSNVRAIDLPKHKIEGVIEPYNPRAPIKFFNSSGDQTQSMEKLKNMRAVHKPSINYMVQEFERRKAASESQKIRYSKTGMLNMRVLHKTGYSEDVFKQQQIVFKGKSHGFVMFVDWSGSMDGENIRGTMVQTFQIAMFCRKLNIPFDVYLIRSGGVSMEPVRDQKRYYSNYFAFGGLKLTNVLSSRMSRNHFESAMQFMAGMTTTSVAKKWGLGGTPLDNTLIVADQIVASFKEQNKLDIVNVIMLTDGESNHPAIMEYNAKQTRNQYDQIILYDHVTKKVSNHSIADYTFGQFTSIFVTKLKERTHANLVCFYVGGHPSNFKQKNEGKKIEFFKKNGFCTIDDSPYDKYFVVNAKRLLDETPSTNFKSGKIMLSEFIQMISDFN